VYYFFGTQWIILFIMCWQICSFVHIAVNSWLFWYRLLTDWQVLYVCMLSGICLAAAVCHMSAWMATLLNHAYSCTNTALNTRLLHQVTRLRMLLLKTSLYAVCAMSSVVMVTLWWSEVNCFDVMQVEEILNEVKFSKYVETGECKTDIDLPDFIRCNHNYSGHFLFCDNSNDADDNSYSNKHNTQQQWCSRGQNLKAEASTLKAKAWTFETKVPRPLNILP